MPDTTSVVDSPDTSANPLGTEEQANDQAAAEGADGAEKSAPTGFDDDFLKKLDALDPSADPATLPKGFNERFVPKAVFTQKTQALAEEKKQFEAEKRAIFELARKAISDKNLPTGPTAEDIKMKELRDLAVAGDPEAFTAVVRAEAQKLVQPIQTEQRLQNAVASAQGANPYVKTHWNEIVQTIQNDPVIAKLASMDNYAAADRVMIALGLEHQVRDMAAEKTATQAELTALKAKVASLEKERAAGLPSSTSRAGSTTGAPAAGDATDITEAARKAWIAHGYRESDFG